MTQREFDELDAVVVHLTIDNSHPARALCSGEVIELFPMDGQSMKECQACYRAVREMAWGKE